MAKTAEGQAKLRKMLKAGMGRQQAMKLLIGAQKKANAAAQQPVQQPVQQPAEQIAVPEPMPAETGNPVIDQANVLASILNSPLYTESIKSAYLTDYLPGLTQANYEINKARAQEVQSSFLRQQAQTQAIRDIAGSYAARGMRTPKMVTEGFAPVQQATELDKAAAEQAINELIAGRDVLYGTGAQDAETFITNPTLFGSIGAGARRSALSELMQLPEMYGLTQVAQASASPLGGGGAVVPERAPNVMPTVPEGGVPDSLPPAGEVTPVPLPTKPGKPTVPMPTKPGKPTVPMPTKSGTVKLATPAKTAAVKNIRGLRMF